MIDDDKWFFVSGALKEMEKQSDRLNKAIDGIMIAPESPLIDTQYKINDCLISALSFLIDDFFENISWFVYECDFGRDAKEAGCKNNMKTINSHDRLRWLINLNCEN